MITGILRASAFFVFIGRAWQHLFQDGPYRTLFWNESLFGPLVNAITPWSWSQYVTHPMTDTVIQMGTRIIGIGFLFCAIFALTASAGNRRDRRMKVLISGAAGLMFLAFLEFMGRGFQVGQFFEYSAQFMSPVLLVMALRGMGGNFSFRFLLLSAVALTFSCHGLYAFGYYAVPGNFIDMVIRYTGMNEDHSVLFLRLAGFLDFAVVVSLLVPAFRPIGLGWAVLWGLATSLARVLYQIDSGEVLASLLVWAPHAIYRFPHALLPLAALFVAGGASRSSKVFNWKSGKTVGLAS